MDELTERIIPRTLPSAAQMQFYLLTPSKIIATIQNSFLFVLPEASCVTFPVKRNRNLRETAKLSLYNKSSLT